MHTNRLICTVCDYRVFWGGIKSGDCGIGFLCLGIIFLSMIAIPICFCLLANKYFVYPDSIWHAMLCILTIPTIVFLAGYPLTVSHHFRLQNTYYFLNPLVHGFEYILEIFTYFTKISVKNPAIPALCLAQLTEVVMLTVGMRMGTKPSSKSN